MKNALFFLLLFSHSAFAQKTKKRDKIIMDSLRSEISFLASDRLEGRRAGTPGEKLAYEYLTGQFKNIGLVPKGDNNSFIQAFEINQGKQILPSTHLVINSNDLVVQKDFFPSFIVYAAGICLHLLTIHSDFGEKTSANFFHVKSETNVEVKVYICKMLTQNDHQCLITYITRIRF